MKVPKSMTPFTSLQQHCFRRSQLKIMSDKDNPRHKLAKYLELRQSLSNIELSGWAFGEFTRILVNVFRIDCISLFRVLTSGSLGKYTAGSMPAA